MAKVLGCVLIILSSTLAGAYLSEKLRQRRNFLKEFLSFLNSLKIQLRYSSGDIFQTISLCGDFPMLNPLLSNIKEGNLNNTSFKQLWAKSVCVIPKSFGLKKSDINALLDFGSTLGTTDTMGELSHIDLYTEIFKKALDNAQEDLERKSKLYKTMGFFLGTSVALMIV